MQSRAAIQGAIQYRAPMRAVYGWKRRTKTCASSTQTDSRSFLNQRLDDITLCESPLMKIKTGELCDQLIASCRKLFSFSKDGFRIDGDSSVENFVHVIEQMEEWASNHDLTFIATKRLYEDEVTFVLYREETELSLQLFHFFISPAESLPDVTASLYKRFICFVAYSLGISVMPESSDNRYLEMMLNNEWYVDDEEDIPETYKLYNEESVHRLFEDVDNADIRDLYYDFDQHRKECDPKVLDLVELMMEGMEVVPPMNVFHYDFNPFDSGFGENDGVIELMSTLAILYSPNDGMDDSILEAANSDNYCGLVPQGWNRWLILSPDMSSEDYDALITKDDRAKRFLEWTGRFYHECVKFDNYKKEKA